MTREYEQVRDDLKGYLMVNSIPQCEFAREHKLSASEVSRFLTGNGFGESRKLYWTDVIANIIYANTTEEEENEEETVVEEDAETEDMGTLDETITKLIDKKIEETMKQIAELETKVKNLEASRDIIKELLD